MEHVHRLSVVCELDWLAPTTRQALQAACEAAREMHSLQIYPEHLLLGLFAVNEGNLAKLFQTNSMNIAQIRERVQESCAQAAGEVVADEIPFSDEANECLRRTARLLVSDPPKPGGDKQVSPELLTLNLLYYPRIQHILAPVATAVLHLHTQLLEYVEKPALKRWEWRLLFSRVPQYEEQLALHYVTIGQHRRILKSIESPSCRLRDLSCSGPINHKILNLVALLSTVRNNARSSRGQLLLEQPGKQIKQMVRAMAGEARVPLTTIFSPVLAEMWLQSSNAEQCLDRLRELFLSLHMLSFGLIYFENLDHLAMIDERDEQEEWRPHFWPMFLEEVDKLLDQPGMVLLASTRMPETLPAEIMIPSRLGQGIAVETLRGGRSVQLLPLPEDKARPSANPLPLSNCPSCQRHVLKHWQYCVYCGGTMSRTCPKCGALSPEIPDARFCFGCGYGPM